jgi:hypothetical protein
VLSLIAAGCYPIDVFYGEWLSFEEWCQRGGIARANFWESQDWANLERARFTRYTMRQRHWPEEPYLHECLADLSGELWRHRRKQRRPAP